MPAVVASAKWLELRRLGQNVCTDVLMFESAKYGFGFSTILALEWQVPAEVLRPQNSQSVAFVSWNARAILHEM